MPEGEQGLTQLPVGVLYSVRNMYRVMKVDLEQPPFSAYSETLPRTYNYGYMYEPVNTDHDPLASDILSLTELQTTTTWSLDVVSVRPTRRFSYPTTLTQRLLSGSHLRCLSLSLVTGLACWMDMNE